MSQITSFGEAIFSPAEAAGLIQSLMSFVTDNIAGVLIVLGTIAGLLIVTKMVNGAKKGKLKV